MKVVAVDGLINMFKDARTRLNPRDYHSLVEYDTRDTMLLNFIQMLQLADGVELIKCEDCKHWYSDADCGMACEFTNMSQPNDGFCNWGVPKENKADTPQTEDEYFLELMDTVKRGEISDAEANQALYEYINKQTEMSDTPQTDECEGCKHYVYQLGCTHHATCEYEPKEPQTETQTETQNSNLTFEKTDCEITECDYHKYCKERGQTDCGWK